MAFRKFYWTTFILSVIILLLNIGLGLMVFGIFIIAVLILHYTNGLRLKNVKSKNSLVVFSAVNLLAFALVRPDGVHMTSEIGLSSVLHVFGIKSGYDLRFEDYYYLIALVLFVVQFVLEIGLRRASRMPGRI
jgi:hypothetical protein